MKMSRKRICQIGYPAKVYPIMSRIAQENSFIGELLLLLINSNNTEVCTLRYRFGFEHYYESLTFNLLYLQNSNNLQAEGYSNRLVFVSKCYIIEDLGS